MRNLDSILKRDITLLTKVCLVKAMVFSSSWTIKKAEHRILLKCNVGEEFWKSLGLQKDQTSQSYRKSDLNICWKDWCWRTPILWTPDTENWLIGKDPNSGKNWRQKEKGMTEDEIVVWTWVWVGSGSWWWTGKPGVLKSFRLQRVGHDWATELNWTDTWN